jgi:hypothetical protein
MNAGLAMLLGNADTVVATVGVLSSMGAAVFWLWASLISVPDNQDTFIAALKYSARINALAAVCATVASCCAVYTFAKPVLG